MKRLLQSLLFNFYNPPMLFDNSKIRMSKIEFYLGAEYPKEFKEKIKNTDNNDVIKFQVENFGEFQLLNESWLSHYNENHDGLQTFIDCWQPFANKNNVEFITNFYNYSECIFLPFAKTTEYDRDYYLFFISEKNRQSNGEVFCIRVQGGDSELHFIGNSIDKIFGRNWLEKYEYSQKISDYLVISHLIARDRKYVNDSIHFSLSEQEKAIKKISCEYYLKLSKIAVTDNEYYYQDEVTVKYVLVWNNFLFECSMKFELIDDKIESNKIYFREGWFEKYAMRDLTSHTRRVQMLQLAIDSFQILLEVLPDQFNKKQIISFVDDADIDSICCNQYTEFELIIL